VHSSVVAKDSNEKISLDSDSHSSIYSHFALVSGMVHRYKLGRWPPGRCSTTASGLERAASGYALLRRWPHRRMRAGRGNLGKDVRMEPRVLSGA
jgi:hypothetical protein